MEKWRENLAVISRLKVAGSGRDALGQRLFFERLFGAANFHPSGISPQAVVCIRKLNAPPFENNRQHFAALSLDWEIGIRGAVENLTRRAFRPFRETVPTEAESVIFEDTAEMLACLARDWLSGDITGCWWWRTLFPKLFRTATIVQIWLERAEFAPASLEILSKTGAAEKFVRKLESPEAVAILREIVRIFGLGKLSAALSAPTAERKREASKSVIELPPKIRLRVNENQAALAKSDAFFEALLPELKASDLSFERRVLLETAFLLGRIPRLARSPEFAERAILMREKNEFMKTEPDKKAALSGEKIKRREEISQIQKITEARPRDKNERLKSESPGEKRELVFFDRYETEKVENSDKMPPAVSPKTRESAPDLSFETDEIEAPTTPAKIEFEAFQSDADVDKSVPATKSPDNLFSKPATSEQLFESYFEAVEPDVELSFRTRFGGVFYLLNLALYLGLYRDFTESLTDEIDLDIWDFVALVGLEFLGERIKTDDVWEFLKRAASRENDSDFGREFDAAQDWRVPPAWLATFSDDQTWTWANTKKRLVVRHADGFNVVDVRRRGRAGSQLGNELEIYRKSHAQIVKSSAKTQRSESKSWLKNLSEYLQKRLFQALNLNTADELNKLLFEQRANVSVSMTRLEITFALADLPVEVRLAGIDRDPAWIPAAGKYVYFHYV